MNTCSILIISCDKNVDLVEMNLKFLNINWADCPFDIYVGLEKLNYEANGVNVLNSNEIYWSKRVKGYLRDIDSEYVFIILDDFIIEKPVSNNEIFDILEFLSTNNNVANMALASFPGEKFPEDNFKYFVKRKKKSNCLLNWQMGLWRTKTLLNIMADKENPWESELLGSPRTASICDKDFYCLNDDKDMPVVYDRGWLVVQGCWNRQEVQRFVDQYGIEIDVSRRPVKDKWNLQEKPIVERIKRRLRICLYQIYYKLK